MADPPHKSKAVKRLIDDSGGKARVRVDEETGHAKFIRFPKESMRSSRVNNKAMKKGDRAKEFFREYGAAFGVEDTDAELEVVATGHDVAGGEHIVLAQTYEDIPVFGGQLRAHFDRDGELATVNGTFVAGLKINKTPTLTIEHATARAIRTVFVQQSRKLLSSRCADDLSSTFDQNLYAGLTSGSVDLMAFREGLLKGTPGADHLVYRVEVRNSVRTIREFVFVDAHSGKVVDQITGIYDGLDRRAYDAEGFAHPGPNFPAAPFWVEGQIPFPTGTVEADNMIYASGETYTLFNNLFGRDSFDGLGAAMLAIFNRGDSCPNVSWNGTYISFCAGVTTDDVTGHEWGHAYTQYTNNLIYQWQSGALNESYSDIWGETVDLINGRGGDLPGGLRSGDGSCAVHSGGTDNSLRWLMGEDSSGFGGAIRDMWNPTCYGDPGKVSDNEYHCATSDQGGVHSNSAVPNHAFALMVDGGTYNGETVTALGLVKSAHIQWAAQEILTPASNFIDNADALEAACSSLIGINLPGFDGVLSGEIITLGNCSNVATAITAVEMRTVPTQCDFEPLLAPEAPALCENLGATQTRFFEDFESGSIPADWFVGYFGVVDLSTFDTPDWDVVDGLPAGNSDEFAAFAQDVLLGDCALDNEAGAIYLESPPIVLPLLEVPHVAFDHWVATEFGWDGGNVKVSVNGAPFVLVPGSDYSFNPYNTTINTSGNPLSGEEGFSGTDGGALGGSWGQSQISLFGLALPGDTVVLTFDFGVDECGGAIGWYVDNVHVYSCSDEPLPVCGDGAVEPGEMCDDGNNDNGDGCSATCGIEDGWNCSNPGAKTSSNIVGDWSFESGYPNTHWDPLSTYPIPGFPIYQALPNTGQWSV